MGNLSMSVLGTPQNVYEDTSTSVFDPKVEVPVKMVAVDPALRKKCSKVRGTAGPRRASLLKSIEKQKKKSKSKIGYV